MRVKSCIIKTAQSKAGSEEGKFSEAYAKEALSMLMHPEDMNTWHLKDGMHVSCTNPDNRRHVILIAKTSRYVSRGMVNLIASPWITEIDGGDRRFLIVDIEQTTEAPESLDMLLEQLRGHAP
nr:hypothetical protein [Candidatus Sigynarchaeota archaeon]